MKKFSTLILACLMACCFLFTGCAPKGTYKLESLKYEDEDNSITCNLGDKYEGIVLKEDTFILIMNDDNTYVFRIQEEEKNNDGETLINTRVQCGTWMEGYKDEIYYTFDGFTTIAKKESGKIVIEIYDVTITLKK